MIRYHIAKDKNKLKKINKRKTKRVNEKHTDLKQRPHLFQLKPYTRIPNPTKNQMLKAKVMNMEK